MTLSTSRQQFLAYETQNAENIQYGRKGGIFVSNCICISFIIFAVLVAVIVGVIAHFITYFKFSQKNVEFWDETEPFGQTGTPSPDLRLPSSVVPSFYRLKIKADLDNSNFTGKVFITVRANRQVKEIILHSKNLSISDNAKLTEQIYEQVETLHTRTRRDVDANVTLDTTVLPNNTETTTASTILDINSTSTILDINSTSTNLDINSTSTTPSPPKSIDTQVTHSNARNIKILTIMESTGDRLVVVLATALQPGVDYILELSFKGNISNSLTGFYKSSYINKNQEVRNLGVTQFEPTSARSAFPCFDEPAFKAKFEISIAHPDTINVLSNMKASATEPIADQPGWQWTHFERSVDMSTYLVAYILCDFEYLETSYLSMDNITKTIKVWTRPELISKANYALTITPKLLAFYEEVFGLPYALDKLDLIAIPDFSSGAMENWGLITFREVTLLWDSAESVPRDKQNVAIDVAHELAHQWFGNLVTMRWWDDLWLNEGFATYIEYVGVDHIEPSWNMLESLTRDKMDLLRSDALKNTSPVARRITDTADISQKFDEISYTKGANLVRMLNCTLTKDLFYKGLNIYLNEWKYSNAEENDLWKAMSKATETVEEFKGLSLVEFMNSWTKQAGYPVVKVNRNYETGAVELEQRLFTSGAQPYQAMVDQLWHIPLTLGGAAAAHPAWLRTRLAVLHTELPPTEPLYVNVDATGYYRVNYDDRNWQLLGEALKSGAVTSPVTKAQLIDDAFNLAKASQLEYGCALGLTTCVANGEDSKLVWDLLLNNMAFLNHNLRTTPGYIYFQDYMKIILKKQLERVNYGLDKPRDDNEAFLIENLVMWECMVEAPRCIDWARAQFDAWRSKPDINDNPIPSYLRSLVYSMALRHGGRREFDFLWEVFQNSTDPNVKSLVINCLPSTRVESLISTLLEKSLSEIPKQYAVAVWSVEAPRGTVLAQRYLRRNFARVHARFTSLDAFTFPAVLGAAFGFITTQDELDILKSFALEHRAALLPMSQTLQKLVDTATLRIDWLRKHAAGINKWFEDYVTGKMQNTTNTTSTTTTLSPIQSTNTTDSVANVTQLDSSAAIITEPNTNVTASTTSP